MIRIRVIALIIVAGCLTSAVASATAFASTEIVNSKGEALVKNNFVAKSGKVTLETVGGTKLACAASTSTGKITSKVAGEETLTLTGCGVGSNKCNTSGSAEGSISIKFKITLLSFDLSMSISIEITFSCGLAGKYKLKGSFLSPVGAEQEELKSTHLFTGSQFDGMQNPIESEKVKHTLELENSTTGKTEEAGVEGTQEVTFEEPAKLG